MIAFVHVTGFDSSPKAKGIYAITLASVWVGVCVFACVYVCLFVTISFKHDISR